MLEILRKRGGITSRRPNSSAQAETDQSPVAPDMYDPVSNRDTGESVMTSEDSRLAFFKSSSSFYECEVFNLPGGSAYCTPTFACPLSDSSHGCQDAC